MAANNKFSITAILGVDSSALAKGFRDAKKQAAEFAVEFHESLVKGAKLAAAAIVTATVGVTAASLNEFRTYEQEFLQILTLLGAKTKDEQEDIDKRILLLAKQWGILPVEAAKAIYQAVSAGQTLEQAFKLTGNAARLAVGSAAPLEETMKLLIGVMNAYAGTSETAASVTDKLAKAIEIGAMRGSELVTSFHGVSAISGAAGLSLEQIAAALATITLSGVPAEQAVTQLRSALVSMMAAESGHIKAIEEGLKSTKGQIRTYEQFKELMLKKPDGLLQAMLLLNEAAGNDKTGGLKEMLGRIEGMQGLMSLTKNDGIVFREAIIATGASAGAAAKQFGIMEGGMNRMIIRLKTQLSVAMIQYAKAILPMILSIVGPISKKITDAFEAIDWKEFQKKFEQVVGQMFKILEPIGRNLWDAISKIDFSALFQAVLPAIKLAISVVEQFSEVLKELLPIVGPAVLKGYIIFFGRFLVYLKAALSLIQAFMPAIKKIVGAISGAMDTILALVGNLSGGGLKDFGAGVLKFVESLLDGAATLVLNFVQLLQKMILAGVKKIFGEEVSKALGAAYNEQINDIKQIIKDVFKFLKELFSDFMGYAKTYFAAMSSAIKSNWPSIKASIISLIESFQELWRLLVALFKFLLPILGFAAKAILIIAGIMVSIVIPLVVKLFTWWLKMYSIIYKVIAIFWLLLKVAIMVLSELIASVSKVFEEIFVLIFKLWQIVTDLFDFLKKMIGAAFEYFSQIVSAVLAKLEPIFSFFKSSIETSKELLFSLFDSISAMISSVLGKVEKAWNFISKIFKKSKKEVAETNVEIEKTEQTTARLNKEIEKGESGREKALEQTVKTGEATLELAETVATVETAVEGVRDGQKEVRFVTEQVADATQGVVEKEIIHGKIIVENLKGKERELAIEQEIAALKAQEPNPRKLPKGELPPITGPELVDWNEHLKPKPKTTTKKPAVKQPPINVVVKNNTNCICEILSSMDKSLKSIDFSLKGKFVNQ
jgi:TP901 family phage tail tape measure protein